MKKKLLLCSLLCLLAAATSVAASNNLSDPATEETQNSTTIAGATDTPTTGSADPETPTEDASEHLLTRINLFGDPIGIYHLDWKFEMTKVSSEMTESGDSQIDSGYIDDAQTADQSMMLKLTLPLSENGNAIQVKVGLDFRQAIALKSDESISPSVDETTTAATTVTTVPTTNAPTTLPSTTVAPETEKPSTTTTATPTTSNTTTSATTTATPTTQAPTTTATPTTQTPTTLAPTTQAPITTTQKTSLELGAIPETVPAFEYTEEEYDLLARIIHCEAGGEELEGMIAVGTVVMNRVESSKFPNNIHDVIFQKGQFTPALSGKVYQITPNAKSCEAARRVLAGERTDMRILYFRSSKYASQPWMNGQRTLIITIDKQSFYS